MLRAGIIAAAIVLVAQSASAQQTGFYGGTAQERKFAKTFYEEHKEEGIEYVSISFRLMSLTIYPSEPLYKSWLSSEATARINIPWFSSLCCPMTLNFMQGRSMKYAL